MDHKKINKDIVAIIATILILTFSYLIVNNPAITGLITLNTEIEDIYINQSTQINLLNYFSGENLSFTVLPLQNFDINIEKGLATITSLNNFIGEETTIFTAYENGKALNSNLVKIISTSEKTSDLSPITTYIEKITFNQQSLFSILTDKTYATCANFDAGSYNDTYCNASTQIHIQLNQSNSTGNYTSDIINAGSNSKWDNISWTPGVCYQCELPNSQTTEIGYFNNTNMSDNLLLLHFNNDSNFAENDTHVYDFSGTGNNGTVTGAIWNSSGGKFGDGAFEFLSGDYINLSTPDSLTSLQNNMTITGWFYQKSSTGNQPIIAQYKSTSNHLLVKLIRVSSGSFDYFTSTSSGGYQAKSFSINPSLNKWHFFAIRVNGSDSSPQLIMQIDERKENFTLSALSATPDTSVPIYIGTNERTFVDQFIGVIEELALWNRSLSDEEIMNLYKRGILNLTLQVQSCNDAACNGETFVGPDNTSNTFLKNSSFVTLNETITPNNTYFQYRLFFETENVSYTPELYNVTIGYTLIDPDPPQISFSAPTDDNNTYFSRTWIYANVSITEDNPANITFNLHNLTEQINITRRGLSNTNNNISINWTNLSEGKYYYNISTTDTSNNANTTATREITLDTVPPNVTITSPDNASRTNTTTIVVNWTFTDTITNISACWYHINDNSTNTTISDCRANGTSITLIKGIWNNFTLWANDSAGNENKTELKVIGNRLPRIPDFIEPNNNTSKIYNNLTFKYNSSDIDDDNISQFNIQIATDNAFTSLIANATPTGNYTNTSLQNGILYWKVRAYDGYEYSNFTEIRTIDVIRAIINITSPVTDTLVYPGASYTIKINETNRTDWITNITIQILNDGVETETQANDTGTTWQATYTIPANLAPRTLTVIARGYNNSNASNGESINTTSLLKLTRSTGTAVSSPVITKFTTNPTYQASNNTINITIIADLDTLISDINTTLIAPNNTRTILIADTNSSNSSTFIYKFNYTYNGSTNGMYNVTTIIEDINSQTTNRIINFYINNTKTIAITTSNTLNISIIDISSNEVILKNDSIHRVMPPGEYDLEIETSKPTIYVKNTTLNETTTLIMNYTDIGETITSPSGVRAVDQFQINFIPDNQGGNITYNYTNLSETITNENNLKLYKCQSSTNCTWTQLNNIQINSTIDTITADFSDFSIFVLSEDTAASTTTTVIGSGGGSTGGRIPKSSITTKLVSLNLLAPPLISLDKNDEKRIKITLKNLGDVLLRNIKLSIISDSDQVKANILNDLIEFLAPNGEISTDLIISSQIIPGKYTLEITASGSDPIFITKRTILIELDIEDIRSKIKFTKKLFKANPECLELSKLIDIADQNVEKEQLIEANAIIDEAIQSCKDLLERLEKPLKIPKQFPANIIITINIIIGITIILILIRVYRNHFRFKPKRKSLLKIYSKLKK